MVRVGECVTGLLGVGAGWGDTAGGWAVEVGGVVSPARRAIDGVIVSVGGRVVGAVRGDIATGACIIC